MCTILHEQCEQCALGSHSKCTGRKVDGILFERWREIPLCGCGCDFSDELRRIALSAISRRVRTLERKSAS